MKYLILIPDGVGIRNFLCTSFIDYLINDGEVIVWHQLPDESLDSFKTKWGSSVHWERLPIFREGLMERILRLAKIFAQIYWRAEGQGRSSMLSFRRPSGRILNYLITWSAKGLGRLLGNQWGTIWLDRQHAWFTLRAGYLTLFGQFLGDHQPDIVFCTHQRASLAVPAMLAARKLNIPTATFIYSWDNLPKGRMAVHAGHFLVWSELMKAELRYYYPEVQPDFIHVVGTPQFEHYFNPDLVRPKGDFLKSLGLDPKRHVVCFSGDDQSTSPHDPSYLADLANILQDIPESDRPQLVFRRCPVDLSGRYQRVLDRFPEIINSEPLWASTEDDNWTQIIPNMEDVELLVNIVSHCDLVVNLGSTMAMDFAIFDKPGIFVNYDPENGEHEAWVKRIYQLPHFETVHQLQSIYWANSADELGSVVQNALTDSSDKASARQQWLHTIVQHPLEHASQRCYKSLHTIISITKNDTGS
jgi:hypothetical protein